MATTIHMNDSGVLFLITVKDETGVVDLTTVENIDVVFQKPDKSFITRPCETVNAAAGLVRYVSATNDFNQSGRWRVQVVIRFSDDNVKHSDVGTLTVERNIPL